MKTIKGNVDQRHTRITAAMTASEGVLLPKTVAASKANGPLVVLAVRHPRMDMQISA